MALDTGALIRRAQWTVHPVTTEVQARVTTLGRDEPRLLTWYNRHGEVIGDNGRIQGQEIAFNAEDGDDTHSELDAREDLP